MNALTTPKCFIANGKVQEVPTIILHTPQMTQATSLPQVQPKQIFYISCDQLTPSMAIILFVHALHLGKVVDIQMDGRQFKQDIQTKNNR
jgi:hypothetical protein